MGIYRFILAILVVLGHTSIKIFGFVPGIVAVVSFLLISGFTMETLLEKCYTKKELIRYFYIDRALRVFPQFIFYLVITIIIYYTVGINESMNTFVKDMSVVNIMKNITIIPLGYYMFDGLEGCQIVPPAWTLGLEFSFYIIFPFIYYKKKKNVFILMSIFIFVIAYCGLINTEWFIYRLLPGTLFIFLVGSIIKSSEYEKEKNKVLLVWGISILLIINSYLNSKFNISFNKEVLLGLIIGIPTLIFLKNIRMKKVNILLGNLSYGIYLNHYVIIYIMGKMPNNFNERLKLIGASIVLAFISYKVIEQPVMKLRKSYRNKVLNQKNSEQQDEKSVLV